jgi:hypothetical protein
MVSGFKDGTTRGLECAVSFTLCLFSSSELLTCGDYSRIPIR